MKSVVGQAWILNGIEVHLVGAGPRTSSIGNEPVWWARKQREIGVRVECKASVQRVIGSADVESSMSGCANHGEARWLIGIGTGMRCVGLSGAMRKKGGGGACVGRVEVSDISLR